METVGCTSAETQVISHALGQRENDEELDPVRTRLLQLLTATGSNLRTASLAIGRNAAYLHQFVNRGTPKVLGEDDREMLAEQLGCRPELIRYDRRVRLRARPRRPARPQRDRLPVGGLERGGPVLPTHQPALGNTPTVLTPKKGFEEWSPIDDQEGHGRRTLRRLLASSCP